MSNIISYNCTVNPYAEYNSNVVNKLTRMISHNQNSLNSGDPIKVIRTSPVTITIKKGSCFKDDVLISINEDQEIDLRNPNFYEQGIPFDESGKYYVCIKYSYVKRMPPPEANIIILKPSQRQFFNENDYLLLKIINVEYEEIIPVTYTFSEEFEKLGRSEGWTENAGLGIVDWDYTVNPLYGNKSLRIKAEESSSRYVEATISEEGLSNFYSYMMFNLLENSSASEIISQICYIYSPLGVLQARIGCINGSLRYILGNWATETIIYPNFPTNTVFHMWVEGEIGENILVYLSTTPEKPENPIFNLLEDEHISCPNDFLVSKLSFGALRSGEILIDNIFIDNKPIGSDPPPPTIIEDTSWKKISSSKINSYKSIAFSPKLKLFVAVGESSSDINSFATSIDGITWTSHPSPVVGENNNDETISFDWSDITWSPELELFVAVNKIGENVISELNQQTIAISEDGFTWTPISIVDDYGYGIKLIKILWNKEFGIFFGLSVQGDKYIISENGTDWETRIINDCNINQIWKDVAWSSHFNTFIIVGLNDYGINMLQSSGNIEDGLIWSNSGITFPEGSLESLYKIRYFSHLKMFFVISKDNIYSHEEDLLTWYDLPLPRELTYKDIMVFPNSLLTTLIIGQQISTEDSSIDSFIYSVDMLPEITIWEKLFESTNNETSLENFFLFQDHGLLLASNYNSFNKPSANILLYDRFEEFLQNIIVQENFEGEGRSDGWTNLGQTYAVADWDFTNNPLSQNKSLRLVAFSSPENAQTEEVTSFIPVEDFYLYSIFKMNTQSIPSIDKSPIISLLNDNNNSHVNLSWKNGVLFLDIFKPEEINESYQIETPEEFGEEGISETENLFESWDNGSLSSPSNGYWKKLAYSPSLNRYVAISENKLAYSSDCLNWTYVNIASNYIWSTVVWVPELEIFLAGASSCTDYFITERNYFMTSIDGITWIPREASYDADIKQYEKEIEYSTILKGFSYASSINIDEDNKLLRSSGKAFDDDNETFWMSQIDSSADFEWLAYDLDRKSSLQTIKIYSGEYTPFGSMNYDINPKNFKIQGSNDSTDGSDGIWDDLDTDLNVDGTNTWCEFSISGEYKWVKILGLRQKIYENAYALAIFDMQILGTPLQTEEINKKIPITFSSGTYLLYKDPKNCHDGDLNTYWRSASTENEGSLTEIIFNLLDNNIIHKIRIWGPSKYFQNEEILDNLTNASLMGYNENTSQWEIIKTGIQIQNNDTWQEFIINSNKGYSQLKIIETTKSIGGGLNTVSISEIEFYGIGLMIFSEEKIIDGLKFQSSYEGNDTAEKAFNLSTEDGWTSDPNEALNTQWIAFKPTYTTLFYKVKIYGKLVGGVDLNLKNFSIQTSENSTNGYDGIWTNLQTGLNVSSDGWNEFTFKPGIYTWFKLSANPGINLKFHVSEIEFYGLLDIMKYEIGAKEIVWCPSFNVSLPSSISPWVLGQAAQMEDQECEWYGIAYGNGVFVAVSAWGMPGVIMTSSNGIDWTPQITPDGRWWDVAYGDGVFVAISTPGSNRFMRSTDNGITWTPITVDRYRNWMNITYGGGIFVATSGSAAGDGVFMISTDGGINWDEITTHTGLWQDIIYANGLFVTVENDTNGRIMTSPDGMVWTIRSGIIGAVYRGITYGKGLFVAVGDNQIMTSPDGIDWISRQSPEDAYWESVTYSNGLFVAVGGSVDDDLGEYIGNIMYSYDGINWTAVPTTVDNWWESVTYGNGRFVAVSSKGMNRVTTCDFTSETSGDSFIAGTDRLQISENGINWKNLDVEIPNIKSLISIESDSSIMGISSDFSNPIFYFKIDPELGNIYEKLTTPNRDWIDLTYNPNDNLIVIISEKDGYSLISNDLGFTWDEYQLPILPNQMWKKIIWSPELELFVAFGQGISQTNIMTSPDGIEWTLKSNSHNFEDVIWISQLNKFAGLSFVGLNNYSLINSDFYIRLSLNKAYYVWLECPIDNDVKLYLNTKAVKPENPIFDLLSKSQTFESTINKISLKAKAGMDIILDDIIAKNIPINSYPVIYHFEDDESSIIDYGPLYILNIHDIDEENNRLVNFSKTRVQRIVDPEIFDEIRDPGRIVFSSLLNCYLFGLLDKWVPMLGDEIIIDTTNCVINDLVYISNEDLTAYPAIANDNLKLAIGYVKSIGVFGRVCIKGEFTGILETDLNINIGDSLYLSSKEEGKITNIPPINGYKQLLGTSLDTHGKLYISNFNNTHGNSGWSPPIKLNFDIDQTPYVYGNWENILTKGLKVKTNIENLNEIYGTIIDSVYESGDITKINISWEAIPPSYSFIQYSLINENLLPDNIPIIITQALFTITKENINSTIIFEASSNATLSLINANNVIPGSWLLIKNNSNYTVTITGQTINDNPSGTIILYKHDEILLFSDETKWHGKIFSDRPKTNIITSTKTIQDYDVNSVNLIKANQAIQITLPEASNKPTGSWLKLFNISTGAATLTNDIDSTILYQNQSVELYSDNGKWQKPDMGSSGGGGGVIWGTVTGSTYTYNFTSVPPVNTLYPGLTVAFKSDRNSVPRDAGLGLIGSNYINVCGLGNKPLMVKSSTEVRDIRAKDFFSNQTVVAVYNGTNFLILNTPLSHNALYGTNSTTQGYQMLDSGIKIVWGFRSMTVGEAGTKLITFPYAFPNRCTSVVASQRNVINYWYANEIFITNVTKNNFTIGIMHNGVVRINHFNYIAIGN